MKNLKYFIKELLRTNSGISSKAFFLVAVTIIGCFLLFTCGFVLIYEVVKTGTVHTSLSGLSTFVCSIASLFATAGLTKAVGDRNEHKFNKPDHDE
jgi:uncharacterized membrane protein YhaH (DUF805 family)